MIPMMREMRRAVKQVLIEDVLVQAQVDRDNRNQFKVYETVGMKDTEPPTVIWALLPGEGPEGTYSERDSMQTFNLQVTSWGRTPDESWQLWECVVEALTIGEWNIPLTPYSLMDIVTTGDVTQLPDPDTGWFQTVATYRVRLSQ